MRPDTRLRPTAANGDPRLRALKGGCAVVAAAILAACALVAAGHVDDGWHVDPVAGTWMALARYAQDGTLYPPLYDGERFGGTRYMPVQILLHAGLARITGEELVSGKLIAVAAAVALVALVLFLLVRELEVPVWLALTLLAALAASPVTVLAATSIRGDALPVALQLAAVAIAAHAGGRRTYGGAAGLLCAAALLTKVSALWGPLAIAACLLLRRSSALPAFLAALLLPLAAAVTALQLGTDGRFATSLRELSWSSAGSIGVGALPTKLATLVDVGGDPIAILLPIAFVGVALAAATRSLSIYDLAFLAAIPVTLVLLRDPGTTFNHLLDVGVLTVLLAGAATSRGELADRGRVVLVPLVATAAVWGAVNAYALGLHGDAKEAARELAGVTPDRFPSTPLENVDLEADSILSEDPLVPLSRDRLPVVLDPYMLLRIAREHPDWEADLVDRIERGEFDRVVLRADHVAPDGRIDVADPWWQDQSFGPTIVAAIARSYRFDAVVDTYALYVART